jgi:hypothetical protein
MVGGTGVEVCLGVKVIVGVELGWRVKVADGGTKVAVGMRVLVEVGGKVCVGEGVVEGREV